MWRNTRLAAWTIAAAMLATSAPVSAATQSALMLRKTKKKKKRKNRGPKRVVVTPSDAAAKRIPAQERGKAIQQTGDPVTAGVELDNAASELGDPILYLDAGDAYYAAAEKDEDPAFARASIERARISLDILYFHLDSGMDPDFKLVETSEVPALIVRAQKRIEDAEALIAKLESGDDEPVDEPKKKKKRGKVDRDKALLISGAVVTSLGVVFVGLGAAGFGLSFKHQIDAEHPSVYGAEYDAIAAKGKRANTLAYVGLPLGAVFLGTGIALLVVAKRGKKGKKKKGNPEDDQVSFTPTVAPGHAGFALSGRF